MAWIFRFGRKQQRISATVPLAGDGSFSYDVVGESHYQDELDELCGGVDPDGHRLRCRALLIPEPTNRYDPGAVMVVIEGALVAYVPKHHVPRLTSELKALGGAQAECDAMIVGGWVDRRGTGSYGVKLDLVWPLRQHQ